MIRNEYRRAFIMLRAARQGYGGHARLERRTLTGSLYFIVTAPEGAGPLRAALVGRGNGQYYAAPLGEFTRDRRGQLTLAYAFDPRSIDGRPMEAYAWVAVADAADGCAVVLTGNVEGSRDVDPAALEAAVCALYVAPEAPAADLPAADEPSMTPMPIHVEPTPAEAPDIEPPPTEPAAAEPPPTEPAETQPPDAAAPADDTSPESDIKIYTRIRRQHTTSTEPPAVSAADEPPAAPLGSPRAGESWHGAAVTERGTPEPSDTTTPPQTAAQSLNLDITRPWPSPAEPLRRLFATQAPVESPLGDGYTYIRAALPEGGGCDACLVGLRSADGRVSGVRYALPGTYAPEPPAGLDDYRWHDAGYWVLDIGIS